MKRLYFLLPLFCLCGTMPLLAQLQQPQWEMPFFFEDADGARDTIWIGYDPEASPFIDIVDTAFDEGFKTIDPSLFNAYLFGIPSSDSVRKRSITNADLSTPQLDIIIKFRNGKLPLKITWPDSLLNSDSLPFPDISPLHRAKVWMENDFGIAHPDPLIPCGFHSYLVMISDPSYVLDDFECLLEDSLILTSPDNNFYTTETGIGEINIYVVPLNKPTGVGIDEKMTKQLNCFPNPFNEHLFLQKETADELELILYNSLSQQVTSSMMPHNSTQLEWSTSHLPAGIYFLLVRQTQGISLQKLVKSP